MDGWTGGQTDRWTDTQMQVFEREAWWPSGRALDSGARGRGFDPRSGRRVVSLR